MNTDIKDNMFDSSGYDYLIGSIFYPQYSPLLLLRAVKPLLHSGNFVKSGNSAGSIFFFKGKTGFVFNMTYNCASSSREPQNIFPIRW